ncbi:hypothetical protein Cantr_08326 [Candida viswanathii]|uniref:FAS1 domain-containing protein n=1 Tax=Candida viswanathii TaxID=5486 RepID=A0A367Y3A6_9ASCO|nr:hypothetical protein Cantr_08326 [Candida viswanathii]
MKFSTLVSIATVTTLVAAKNVVNLHDLKIGVEGEEQEDTNEKREPKNVVNLQGLQLGVSDEQEEIAKRDAKNIVNLLGLKGEDKQKRDAKNVVNLHGTTGNDKREPKNVVNLHGDIKEKREPKNVVNLHGDVKEKREAKNVVNLHGDVKEKREPKNVINLQALKEEFEAENSNEKRERVFNPDLPQLEILKQALEGGDEPKRDAKDLAALAGLVDTLKKRDAKNVPNLEALRQALDASITKRDAKNLADLEALKKALDADINKRDAKNLADLDALKKALEASIDKRDAKNLANLEALRQALDEAPINKRETDKVFKLHDFIAHAPPTRPKPKNILDVAELQRSQQGPRGADRTYQEIIDSRDSLLEFDVVDCYNNLLQSVLPQLSSISIFTGYIREFLDIDAKTANPNEVMLVVAPDNDAIETKLNDLKPWEFPKSLESAKDDKEQEEILNDNLLNFLNGHLVNNFEKKLVIDKSVTDAVVIITQLNNGNFLKIKQVRSSDKFFIKLVDHEDWIPVESVKQVENGFVFIIKDSLVKP